jgi:replication factor C subunit 1
MLSGPPGIGKTTTAHLIAKECGYKVIEMNASDTRNKKLLETMLKSTLDNTVLDGFLTGHIKTSAFDLSDRSCLIMDEVDGTSGGDRGGIGALNALIKKTKVPIICIANDRSLQKMKPLMATTYDLRFRRPDANSIRARLMSIAFKEGIKIDKTVADQLVAGTQSDIRQIINILSTWKLSSNKLTFDETKKL